MGARKHYIYAGPKYDKGLNVHGVPGLLDPAGWTVEQTKQMVRRYPQLTRLFEGVPEEDGADEEE